MAHVKAYLFWITCGILLIAEVVIMTTTYLTHNAYARHGKDAVTRAKKAADIQYQKLQNDLLRRARKVNSEPAGFRPASQFLQRTWKK